MLRVVLDTNVLISAEVSAGKSRDLLNLAVQGQFLLIQSEETIEEFERVLQKPKFEKTRQEVIKAKNALARTGRTIRITSKRKIVKKDPDDDIFINTALDGNADYIVTGDPHLLNIASYKGTEIVTVADMLKKLWH